jgi:hypothetical protein
MYDAFTQIATDSIVGQSFNPVVIPFSDDDCNTPADTGYRWSSDKTNAVAVNPGAYKGIEEWSDEDPSCWDQMIQENSRSEVLMDTEEEDAKQDAFLAELETARSWERIAEPVLGTTTPTAPKVETKPARQMAPVRKLYASQSETKEKAEAKTATAPSADVAPADQAIPAWRLALAQAAQHRLDKLKGRRRVRQE